MILLLSLSKALFFDMGVEPMISFLQNDVLPLDKSFKICCKCLS